MDLEHPLNVPAVAFLRRLLTPEEKAWPRFAASLRRNVPIEELRTHPDLEERLAQIAPPASADHKWILAGSPVLVTPSGLIYAIAQGMDFLALRLGPQSQAVALELHARVVEDLGPDWVAVDVWCKHATLSQGTGDLRYLTASALEYAESIASTI